MRVGTDGVGSGGASTSGRAAVVVVGSGRGRSDCGIDTAAAQSQQGLCESARRTGDGHPMRVAIPHVHAVGSNDDGPQSQRRTVMPSKGQRRILGEEKRGAEEERKDRPESVFKLLGVVDSRFLVGHEEVETVQQEQEAAADDWRNGKERGRDQEQRLRVVRVFGNVEKVELKSKNERTNERKGHGQHQHGLTTKIPKRITMAMKRSIAVRIVKLADNDFLRSARLCVSFFRCCVDSFVVVVVDCSPLEVVSMFDVSSFVGNSMFYSSFRYYRYYRTR